MTGNGMMSTDVEIEGASERNLSRNGGTNGKRTDQGGLNNSLKAPTSQKTV